MTKTIEPNLTLWTAVLMLDSTPVHSMASLSWPPAASEMRLPCSSTDRPAWTLYVITPGISFFANARRSSAMSVMTMGVAPAARAATSVARPIGPAPLYHNLREETCLLLNEGRRKEETHQMSRGSAKRSPARSIPASATESGSRSEPSSHVRLSGILWHQLAGCVM